MPTNAVSTAKPTYPGVYVEELPSSARTISTVTTSVTAFVGHTRRGPLNEPVRVAKANTGKAACVALESTEGHSESAVLEVHAKEPGVWGNGLRVAVDYDTPHPDETFNLRVYDARGQARESFTGLSLDPASGRYAPTLVNTGSRLVRVDVAGGGRPHPPGTVSKPTTSTRPGREPVLTKVGA